MNYIILDSVSNEKCQKKCADDMKDVGVIGHYYCNKKAYIKQDNGTFWCQSHFNKWLRKMNKKKSILLTPQKS